MSISIATQLLDTLELRAGSVITPAEIRALQMRWRSRFTPRKNPPNVGEEERALEDALPMRVCDEQAKRGLDYLRKLLLRKDGELRETQLIVNEGITRRHAQVVRTLDHFLFMGFHWDENGRMERPYPIYRAVGHDGEWFEYIARPWVQGPPEFGPIGGRMS